MKQLIRLGYYDPSTKKVVTAAFELEIDEQRVARELIGRAAGSKHRQATALRGGVKLTMLP